MQTKFAGADNRSFTLKILQFLGNTEEPLQVQLLFSQLYFLFNFNYIKMQTKFAGADNRSWTCTLSDWNLNPARLPFRHIRILYTY